MKNIYQIFKIIVCFLLFSFDLFWESFLRCLTTITLVQMFNKTKSSVMTPEQTPFTHERSDRRPSAETQTSRPQEITLMLETFECREVRASLNAPKKFFSGQSKTTAAHHRSCGLSVSRRVPERLTLPSCSAAGWAASCGPSQRSSSSSYSGSSPVCRSSSAPGISRPDAASSSRLHDKDKEMKVKTFS